MTALIDQFNKMKEEGKVMDAFTFSFMGNQALVHGSQRVARAAYQLINESYPDAPGREDNLYYLAMTTWQLGEADKGGELVAQHLKEFPNSKYAPMLNTLSLEGLLKEKKFDLCVQQADKVMELHKDDPTHKFYELALYCKGASLFNLGAADASRYKEAVPVLERFVKEYRDSTYLKRPCTFLVKPTRTWAIRMKPSGPLPITLPVSRTKVRPIWPPYCMTGPSTT